jgi:probable HAF family extracellular repeat protein
MSCLARVSSVVSLSVSLVAAPDAAKALPAGYVVIPVPLASGQDINESGVVAGSRHTEVGGSGPEEPATWHPQAGVVGLGYGPGNGIGGYAEGINTAGQVVGSVYLDQIPEADAETEAFSWSSSGGIVGLGDLSGGR